MPKTPPDDTPDTPETPSSPYAPGPGATHPETPPGAVPPAVPPVAAPPPATAPPAPPPYQTGAPYLAGPQKPVTTLSLLSMIFGIAGVVLSCCYGAGFLFAVAGIVLGHLGRKREPAQGMALTGLITGYVAVGLSLITWVLIFALAFTPLLMLPFLATTGA